MDDRIIPLLQQAEALKTELDSLRPLDKEREAIVLQKLRLDWNFHSNHLEGNSLTFGETKALILFGITAQGKPLKDHFEITGHDEAIKWVEDIVHKKEPLNENFIRQLHILLLKEPHQIDAVTPDGLPTKKMIKVGEYKSTPNHVVTKTGEIFRFATPEETPAKMFDLLEWYREKETDKETNPILFAADFHYKFIRIHPFDDGNGRMARILMNFILMQYGYPPVIIKTGEKAQYIAALEQADAGIFEPFFEFVITNETRSLELMLKGAHGESIDEPDDLDKELALLEQRLKEASIKKSAITDEDKIKAVINNVVFPLVDSVYNVLWSFEKFYKKLNIFVYAIKKENDSSYITDYLNSITITQAECSFDFVKKGLYPKKLKLRNFTDFNNPIFTHRKNLIIKFEFELGVFRIPHLGGKEFLGVVDFFFSSDKYNISTKEVSIDKRYEQTLTSIEVEQIIKKINNNITEYLSSLEQ
jgi:Fic family protein